MHPVRRGATYVVIAAALIAPLEGMDRVARHQNIDPLGVITWCYGRTNFDDPTVKAGTRFNKDQCDEFLQEDIPRYYAPVEKCIHVKLTEHEKAALTSANYNTGAVCKSPMVAAFNRGEDGCNYFQGWRVHSNGKYLQGLANRRVLESKVCHQRDVN